MGIRALLPAAALIMTGGASTRASLVAVIKLIKVGITIAHVQAVLHAPRISNSWLYRPLSMNGSPTYVVVPACPIE